MLWIWSSLVVVWYSLAIFTWDAMHIPYIFGMISEFYLQQLKAKILQAEKGRFHRLTLPNMLTENI